jgi:long-chain acyl-CoA synthetase
VTTYADLQKDILRCAAGLADLGIKKGDTWGLILRNCPEFLILSMALSKLGAICVPINFLEKADRVALILNDAKAVGVLTAKEFSKTIQDAAPSLPALKFFYVREKATPPFKNFSELLTKTEWSGSTPVNENDTMMLLYTSGTTGLPKGVMLSHKNFLVNVDQCLGGIALKKEDRFLCLLPMFHSFSWTTCVMIPMKLGASIVIIESLLPFDPVIKAIWNHKVTLFVAVPQIFSALTTKIKGLKALLVRFMNPIRVCISGAAPLPPGVHESFEKTFGVELLEGYGLTEASPVLSMNPQGHRKIGTVGKALPGVQIQIRGEDGAVLPVGEVGEIYAKGENIMRGYYNKSEETKECVTSDGWLITGDMGRLDNEGYLTIVDRKKDLIIVKGLNVYPQEIENVLATHPSVKEAAVVGKMDKETGEETIIAYITLNDGVPVEKKDLFDLCRDKLAAYKRPKDIVVIDEMPKNALQKILKKDLRSRK